MSLTPQRVLISLIVLGFVALGVLGGQHQFAQAADCGAAPLPPCQNQGAGQDPTAGQPAPTNTPGATCGYVPLPPCQTQAANGTGTNPGGSTAPTNSLVVSDVQLSGTNQDLTFTFRTNRETTATVSLIDQLQTADQPQAFRLTKASLDHEVHFKGLPKIGKFQIKIEVFAAQGTPLTKDDLLVTLANGTATLSQGQNASPTTPGGTAIYALRDTPPSEVEGPVIQACHGYVVFFWKLPEAVGYNVVVTNQATKKVVSEFRPVPPLTNLIIFGFTETNPNLDSRFFQPLSLLEAGQTYQVQLSLFPESGTPWTVPQNRLTGTFTLDNDGDQPFCGSDKAIEFLNGKGIDYHPDGAAGATSNTGSQARPGTSGAARQTGLPQDSVFGPFVNTVLDQPLFVLGAREYRRLDLLAWLYYLLVLTTAGLGSYFFIKRRRLWGIIYDARSKQPVELAVVRLFDQEHHKLLETRVTPKSGRYSFLAEPGEYYLEVTKEGYHFPSRIVTQAIDNEYSNLYRGEVLKLGVAQSLIAPDIPVDTESGEVKRASFYRRIVFPLLDRLRLPILLIALLLTPFFVYLANYAYFTSPWLFFVSSFLVVIFLISEFLFIRRGRK